MGIDAAGRTILYGEPEEPTFPLVAWYDASGNRFVFCEECAAHDANTDGLEEGEGLWEGRCSACDYTEPQPWEYDGDYEPDDADLPF